MYLYVNVNASVPGCSPAHSLALGGFEKFMKWLLNTIIYYSIEPEDE